MKSKTEKGIGYIMRIESYITYEKLLEIQFDVKESFKNIQFTLFSMLETGLCLSLRRLKRLNF